MCSYQLLEEKYLALEIKYQKFLEFVKNRARLYLSNMDLHKRDIDGWHIFPDHLEIQEARELLKEIGEME
jgi:hypothetical protein